MSCRIPSSFTAADFEDATMIITFLENSSIGLIQCADFAIADDELAETMESFTVTGSGGNFMGGQDSTQVTIQDNDGKKVHTRPLVITN